MKGETLFQYRQTLDAMIVSMQKAEAHDEIIPFSDLEIQALDLLIEAREKIIEELNSRPTKREVKEAHYQALREGGYNQVFPDHSI